MADSVDDAILITVTHDYIHGYLANHFLKGTWPTEHEFLTEFANNCNKYPMDIQGYLEYHVVPQVRSSLFAFTFLMLTINLTF